LNCRQTDRSAPLVFYPAIKRSTSRASSVVRHPSTNRDETNGGESIARADFLQSKGPLVGDGTYSRGINASIPVSSSQSAWVAGGTQGVGGTWQPAFLQGYDHPVSLFAEYQHT
jgi:hypothetical protein